MVAHASNSPFLPIFESTRNKTVELIHYGALAVVDSSGTIIASYGNPHVICFLRSSAKPFQALPLIEAGGVQKWSLTPKEIAIICASHSGTDEHVRILNDLQAKIQVKEKDLLCGVHPPTDEATRESMRRRGENPTPNRHNCSGKHTGMMPLARLMNTNIENYIDGEHPVQKRILQTFSEMCNFHIENIAIGIDGCSAPVFAIPLENAAFGYARLCDPVGLNSERAAACETITQSMIDQPEMVAGPGKFDTRIMEVLQGKIISKGGAEGFQQIGIMPGVLGKDSPGFGIALKISDGDALYKVRPAVILAVLDQLGVMTKDELEKLADFGPSVDLKNWRKMIVGQAHPTIHLSEILPPS